MSGTGIKSVTVTMRMVKKGSIAGGRTRREERGRERRFPLLELLKRRNRPPMRRLKSLRQVTVKRMRLLVVYTRKRTHHHRQSLI
uniref:Uncharacterized protein n=1 Tax=Rhizophora mucronata TaxID=61149 RepID=A0A2P2P5G0_RHIMU